MSEKQLAIMTRMKELFETRFVYIVDKSGKSPLKASQTSMDMSAEINLYDIKASRDLAMNIHVIA